MCSTSIHGNACWVWCNADNLILAVHIQSECNSVRTIIDITIVVCTIRARCCTYCNSICTCSFWSEIECTVCYTWGVACRCNSVSVYEITAYIFTIVNQRNSNFSVIIILMQIDGDIFEWIWENRLDLTFWYRVRELKSTYSIIASKWFCWSRSNGNERCSLTKCCAFSIFLNWEFSSLLINSHIVVSTNSKRQGVVLTQLQEFVIITINLDNRLLFFRICGVDSNIHYGNVEWRRSLNAQLISGCSSFISICIFRCNGCCDGCDT